MTIRDIVGMPHCTLCGHHCPDCGDPERPHWAGLCCYCGADPLCDATPCPECGVRGSCDGSRLYGDLGGMYDDGVAEVPS